MRTRVALAAALTLLITACGTEGAADPAVDDTDGLTPPGVFHVGAGTLAITGPDAYDVTLAEPGAVVTWYEGSGTSAQ